MSFRGTTRLAPSPTGALHLGNARTFLINWVLAQRNQWRILLRIDDLEGPRIKPGADADACEDLRWLGLDWEEPPIRQSARGSRYQAALDQLVEARLVYPCICTRSEISLAAVGRAELDLADFYPGTCRGRFSSVEEAHGATGRPAALRFMVPEREVNFGDGFLGPQQFRGGRDFGDFIVRKSDGEWGYHLANVVDDMDYGVTHIVRGMDLLASAPRQVLLYEALGMPQSIPHYIHLPLVVGPDRRKLAKRHGDTRLCQLRAEGVTAGQVRRMLATWSGWTPAGEEATLEEWLQRFDLSRLSPLPVVYDDALHRPRPGVRGGA